MRRALLVAALAGTLALAAPLGRTAFAAARSPGQAQGACGVQGPPNMGPGVVTHYCSNGWIVSIVVCGNYIPSGLSAYDRALYIRLCTKAGTLPVSAASGAKHVQRLVRNKRAVHAPAELHV